jgi:glycosyltransferase involved in cell wall biosynthesis
VSLMGLTTQRSAGSLLHSVVVPAYNEELGLPIVLDKIFSVLDQTYEVIVVDDGSTDRTFEIASRFPCQVVRHDRNLGKGEALRTAIQISRGRNVIWIDADDTYPAGVIPEIAEALFEYDLVYVSRRWGRENIPLFNRIGNSFFRLAIRGLYGFTPNDPCSGLCGVRKVHLLRMDLRARRFSIEPEIAMKAGRMRLRMLDIPVEYHQRVGVPKLRGWAAGLEDTLSIIRHLLWQPPGSDDSEPEGAGA